MINLLGNQVNKLILVSIPSIFKGDDPQLCRLIAIEPPGLWLASEELNGTLLANIKDRQSGAVFVPFSQIVYLLEGRVTTKVAPTASELEAIIAAQTPGRPKPNVRSASSPPKHPPATKFARQTKSARHVTRKAK